MVADIVRFTPSESRLKKYSIWNYLYLAFIVLYTLIAFIPPSFGTLWMVLLIVIVALKKFKLYVWNTVVGAISLISSIGITLHIGMDEGFESTTSFLVTSIFISLVFILAGIYLPQLFTPKYLEKKVKYLDKSGRQKLRVVHLFEE